jgi:hypothetical protein
MTTRTRAGLVCGAVAVLATATVIASGRPSLRVMIAPAWRTGALASGSIQEPNLPVVMAVAFALGLAVGFFGWTAATSPPASGLGGKIVGVNLILLYIFVSLELAFYPSIAGNLLEAAGVQGVLGDEYPLVFAARIVPGAILFLVIATLAVVLVWRRQPRRVCGVLLSAWLCQIFALLGSVAWYVSPAGPGFR